MAERLTKAENLVLGKGINTFAPFDADGVLMGERDLGEVSGFALTGESERLQEYSNRGGISTLILDVITRLTLSGTAEIKDMSIENQALFLSATVSTRTQASTPIPNERRLYAETNRYYQLGQTASNPAGVRVVTGVTVGLYELVNAAARVNGATVVANQIFKSSTNVFIVTTPGDLAGSAPTYDVTDVGDPTTDGTAVVKFLGVTGNYTVDTDYSLNAALAKIGIVEGGDLGLACDLYFELTGNYLSLNLGYTPQANSRKQASTSGVAEITGRWFFEAINPVGINDHVVLSKCTVAASGESQFITTDAVRNFSLDIAITQIDSATPLVIVDGKPYT
jgi:hypothetical protein